MVQGDREGLPYTLGIKCRGDPRGLSAHASRPLRLPNLRAHPHLLAFSKSHCVPVYWIERNKYTSNSPTDITLVMKKGIFIVRKLLVD